MSTHSGAGWPERWPDLPFTCSCCGYVHDIEDRGEDDDCPICLWTEAPLPPTPCDLYYRQWPFRNYSLWRGQHDFHAMGASTGRPVDLSKVRAPKTTEFRHPLWRPLREEFEEQRSLVHASMVHAFGHLRRGNGMRLFDAQVLDDYGVSEVAQALAPIDYQDWRDIPQELIEAHSNVLSYFDAQAFRFHLPAYACWALEHLHDSDSNSLPALVHHLTVERNEWSRWSRDSLDDFDAQQCRAIALFLQLLVAFDPNEDRDALRALKRHWGQYL